MSRYIDADALWIGKAKREVFNDQSYADGWNSAIEIINAAPTVDAVPVVLCRKCKHHDVFKNGVNGWCNKHECPTDVTYFCADGERITE